MVETIVAIASLALYAAISKSIGLAYLALGLSVAALFWVVGCAIYAEGLRRERLRK